MTQRNSKIDMMPFIFAISIKLTVVLYTMSTANAFPAIVHEILPMVDFSSRRSMPRTFIVQTNVQRQNRFIGRHNSYLRSKMNSSKMSPPIIVEVKDQMMSTSDDIVPKTLGEAYRRFFFGPDYGPSLIVASIAIMMTMRYFDASPITLKDVFAFCFAIVFWSVQEHVIHDKLLHSKFDWQGKRIHQDHHEKTYFHFSIDPPWLICTWLSIVFCLVCIIGRPLIPYPLGLSTVIGYTISGLYYEWCHYIVHTKVQAKKNNFFRKMKQHHIKHHLVNDGYWFGFSVPMIDDVFGTNPDVKSVMNQ